MIILYYIVILKNNGSLTPEQAVIDHKKYLEEMVSKQKVLSAGRLDNNDGLVIYKVNSKDELTELVNLDPFVFGKYRDVETFEWKVSIGSIE